MARLQRFDPTLEEAALDLGCDAAQGVLDDHGAVHAPGDPVSGGPLVLPVLRELQHDGVHHRQRPHVHHVHRRQGAEGRAAGHQRPRLRPRHLDRPRRDRLRDRPAPGGPACGGARATSTSSRGATSRSIRMRIDGVLHPVYRIPKGVHGGHRQPVQDHEPARHRRAQAAGRAHPDRARRHGDGAARLDHAHRLRRQVVVRILDPNVLVRDLSELGFLADEQRHVRALAHAAARAGAGHRPDRQRQDHHALLGAAGAGLARGQRDHHRGSDRDGARGVQPGAGQPQDRHRRSPRRCATCCGRIRTSSWWARSATPRPPPRPCRRRSPATWCSPPCTPTTRWARWPGMRDLGVPQLPHRRDAHRRGGPAAGARRSAPPAPRTCRSPPTRWRSSA